MSSISTASRARPIVFSGLLFFLSALLALFVVLIVGLFSEVYYRWKERASVETHPTPSLVADVELGWDTIKPIAALENTGKSPVVFFVGDSATQNASWPKIAQKILHNEGYGFDAFNIGVSGYGTIQEFLKLKKHFHTQKPTLVVLLFSAWNDMRDNLSTPFIYYNKETRDRPYFSEGHVFNVSTSMVMKKLMELRIYDRFFGRVEYKLMHYFTKIFGADMATRFGWSLPVEYEDTNSWEPFYISQRQDDRYVKAAWAVTEETLLALNNYLSENGAKLVVIGSDNPFTVDQDVFDSYHLGRPGFDIDLPLTRLGMFLKFHNITYRSALPELRALSRDSGKKVYLEPEGNLSGHLKKPGEEVLGKIAGELIREFMRTSVNR